MKIFLISLLFGVLEVLLTAFLINVSVRGKKGIATLIFLSKVITYIGVIWLLVFKYLSKFMNCLSGYTIGAAVTAVALLLYFGMFKKIEE